MPIQLIAGTATGVIRHPLRTHLAFVIIFSIFMKIHRYDIYDSMITLLIFAEIVLLVKKGKGLALHGLHCMGN